MDRLVLRASEAAEALAIGNDEMRHLLRSGQVAGYRTAGGHWRVPASALADYVQRRSDEEARDREALVGWQSSG